MSFQNPVHNKHQSSTSMVLLKYLALAFLVALPAQTNAAARCLNSDTFRKEVDGVPRSCVWIRFLESRRVEHCVDPEVLNECPQTCGQCCDNDRTYKFMTNFDKTVNCKWISKNAKKIEIRRATWCGLTFKNDVNVRDACPLACDFCFDPVSFYPSVSSVPTSSEPSRHPSREPSSEPSMSPTREPSCDPSSSPTREPSRAPSSEPSHSPTGAPSAKPTVSVMPSLAPNYLCATTEQDDEDFIFNMDFNDYPVNCQWLTTSNGRIRQEHYCPRYEIANACRFGCQTCICENNDNFRFLLDNPDLGKKNCKWIAKNNAVARRARYCFDENNDITDDIGRNCPLACGTCA